MKGLMQDWPLLVSTIIEHAGMYHGDRAIISRTIEGPIERTSYAEVAVRARRLADALRRHGLKPGDVVATLAWNTARHIELWYGAMGLGTVVHTVNPRLFPEQLDYIINHGGGRMMFVDLTFVPLLEKLAPKLNGIETYVVLTDDAHMPETTLKGAVAYETFLATGDAGFAWPKFDENTACGLCYTSGTTGNPKGVLYSHRSNVLHAMATLQPDFFNVGARDNFMPVVPMFHANAWATVFCIPMTGAGLVLPGARMDGEAIHELLETENVTCTAAVPTVWMMLLQHLQRTGGTLNSLKKIYIGGSACPETLISAFEDTYGVEVFHAWGMTEMSPIGTIYAPKAGTADLDDRSLRRLKLKQGRPPYSVEMRIVDDRGTELPRDGEAFGHLEVRGPAVAAEYHRGEGGRILDDAGWFRTGDVATIDPGGFMEITDRSKDVIKSGGEWISSIELENVAVGDPTIAEAAAIGLPHPKWGERPLLVVVAAEGETPDAERILAFMQDKVARWWLPDDVVLVDEIPHTATGKINKLALRKTFADHTFSTA